MLEDRKLLILPTPPLFDAPLRGDPLEFVDETYLAKTGGMRLPYGENNHNPNFNRLSMIHPWAVTDGRTDGR